MLMLPSFVVIIPLSLSAGSHLQSGPRVFWVYAVARGMPRRRTSVIHHRAWGARNYTLFISLGTGLVGAFRDTHSTLTCMINTMGERWEALMIPGVMPRRMSLAIAIRGGRAGVLICAVGPTRLRRRYEESSDEDAEVAGACN